MNMAFRAAYSFDTNSVSRDTGLSCKSPSKTVQSHRDDADINVIVRRFGVTGVLPSVQVPPTYGDFSGVSDYRTALHLIRAAQDSFNGLSSEVRNRFQNDPAAFVAFCNDPRNLPEMRKMGLAVPEKAPEASGAGSAATAPAGVNAAPAASPAAT